MTVAVPFMLAPHGPDQLQQLALLFYHRDLSFSFRKVTVGTILFYYVIIRLITAGY